MLHGGRRCDARMAAARLAAVDGAPETRGERYRAPSVQRCLTPARDSARRRAGVRRAAGSAARDLDVARPRRRQRAYTARRRAGPQDPPAVTAVEQRRSASARAATRVAADGGDGRTPPDRAPAVEPRASPVDRRRDAVVRTQPAQQRRGVTRRRPAGAPRGAGASASSASVERGQPLELLGRRRRRTARRAARRRRLARAREPARPRG